jgi:hypothetical protein
VNHSLTGGDFVVKLFDAFTPFTAGILYILYRSFTRIALVKPFSSRPANSERYLLCKHLRVAKPEKVVSHLKKVLRELQKLRKPTEECVKASSGSETQQVSQSSTVSSHTKPPPGFVSFAEKQELGLLDVLDVVDATVLEKEEAFVEFLQETNMK